MNIYKIRENAYASLGKLMQLELETENCKSLDLYTERLEQALFEIVDNTKDIELKLNKENAEVLRFWEQYNDHITSENWFDPFVFEEKEN